MGSQNQNVYERAKHPDRRCEFQAINHECISPLLSECVIVPEITEWPTDHYILKMRWPFHLGDRDGHKRLEGRAVGRRVDVHRGHSIMRYCAVHALQHVRWSNG